MECNEDSTSNLDLSDASSSGTVLTARETKDVNFNLTIKSTSINKCNQVKQDTVEQFNNTFQEFLQTKAELSLDELNRCLVLLGTCSDTSQFEPENMEISTLFINVHKLISSIESRSSLLWTALSFLEQATQNSSARIALVQKFKYMDILSKLLDTLSNPDRILRVLKLLESITYGITITWQEPYLKDLIKSLVNFITGEHEILIATALSTLINLCYKNLPPVYLLLRCIKPEEFLTKIEPYGILACKMSLLLENNLDGVTENDILAFVKFTFSEIHRALRCFNIGLLRHTIEFFADIIENEAICMHFENYDNYSEDVKLILQYIIAMDNSPDVDAVKEIKRGWSQYISLLFEFLINVIVLKGVVLMPLFSTLASCALKWIISARAGTQSLKLLTTLIIRDENFQYLSSIYNDLAKNVAYALVVLKNINPSTDQVSALLKLLSVLLREKLLNDDFEETTKSFFFDSIFGKLFARYNDEKKKNPILPQAEISMYIRAMAILADLADWAPDNSWRSGLDTLLKSPIIQFVIAKAMLCDETETCSFVFRLARLDTFPVQETSEIIVNQGSLTLVRSSQGHHLEQLKPCPGDSLPNNLASFNTEHRLDNLIDEISKAQQSNQINNVLMSDIMELFEYKIAMCTNEERDLLTRLDECNAQVTSQSHKLALLSTEVSRYQSQNFILQMNIDRLKEAAASNIEENNDFQKSLDNYEMALNKENSHQAKLISQIEFKDAEIHALSNQLIEAKNKLKEREDELQRLQELISSERRQNNDLELCVKNLEILREELQGKISEQEQSIRDITYEIGLLVKENSSLEDQVKKAENALQGKTNLLEHYAQDLRDVEEMRTQVVSIMKRKGIS